MRWHQCGNFFVSEFLDGAQDDSANGKQLHREHTLVYGLKYGDYIEK